ncbi:ADP-ribosylglycohydrolase family protein [Peterkaempfera griseoplana]|uniref:ADP-ribosylglycohydrolase family protein n=1 Tax=Peterkaempfera griseoplana TaxID=66896 RepID=UPI0006E333AF|nr:ADP-ribosylglycohydrolase family protein [Peterkaempfera griseoplana]
MVQRSWDELVVRRARIRGCLLGGAVGDALGNPVEFRSLAGIRDTYGEAGVTGPVRDGQGVVGRVTDDTQMTLFTAEALIRARIREAAKGIGGAETSMMRHSYLRWLETQEHRAPQPVEAGDADVRSGWLRQQEWLYARRAPGNACLSGLRSRHVPDPYAALDGRPGPVNSGSKGCGTVMRSAPFGLTGLPAERAFTLAGRCAQITHGHPTGYYAAAALAAITTHLLDGDSLEGAVLRAMELLGRHPGHEETTDALRTALRLAAEGGPTAEKVQSLGAGWIAEEALAIAVYCALAARTVREALLLSVNHSGDSDSTGSVCGNLLGAHHGDVRLPADWLAVTEGRGTIAELADDFSAQFHPADDGSGAEPGPGADRYPG